MTGQEQANRTADLVLELVQARRKLAALQAYADELGDLANPHEGIPAGRVRHRLRAALSHHPAPAAE